MKHTPGPWLYRVSTPQQESDKWGGGNCGANAVIFRRNGKRIYGVECSDMIAYMPHWREESQNEEQIANTKLLAAAPELLDASSLALRELRQFYLDKESEAIRILILAIDKATK